MQFGGCYNSAEEENMECDVQFQNRFVEYSGDGSGRGIRGKQCHPILPEGQCNKTIQDMQYLIDVLAERVDNCENLLEKQFDFMKMLAYRSIDNETRNRNKNLILWGVSEKIKLPLHELVLNFLEDEMAIDISHINVERVYRLGSVSITDEGTRRRPIIVRFNHFTDTETVMKRAYMLKGTPFGIDRDYPREIAVARKSLYGSEEARRARQCNSKVQIKYPARLLINGKVISDHFTDWHKYIHGDRTGYDSCKDLSYQTVEHANSTDSEISDTDSEIEIDSAHQTETPEPQDIVTQNQVLAHKGDGSRPSIRDVNQARSTCVRNKTNKRNSPVKVIRRKVFPKAQAQNKTCSLKDTIQAKSNTCVRTSTKHEQSRRVTRSQSKNRSMEIPWYTTMGERVHIAGQDCHTRL